MTREAIEWRVRLLNLYFSQCCYLGRESVIFLEDLTPSESGSIPPPLVNGSGDVLLSCRQYLIASPNRYGERTLIGRYAMMDETVELPVVMVYQRVESDEVVIGFQVRTGRWNVIQGIEPWDSQLQASLDTLVINGMEDAWRLTNQPEEPDTEEREERWLLG